MRKFLLLPTAATVILATAGCGSNAGFQSAATPGVVSAASLRDASGVSNIVPGRYLVVYREGVMPSNPASAAADSGTEVVQILDTFGVTVLQAPASVDDAVTMARLSAQPDVEYVLRDRYVEGHEISIIGVAPVRPVDPNDPADNLYRTAQNWAVVQAGGFGANVTGGPSYGPWNTTKGAGVRIAVLDTGVDRTHPDIAPNLALNLSEVDQVALPSACDDGSPQDQHGHGTWTASLAAGAAGKGTGGVIGVAPEARLLNIKVLERLPAGQGGSASGCASQAGGLLSWVLQGINDAIANKADVVSMSLGSVIDLYSGDGAGWKASFDRVTHAAALANVSLVAAVGNDGLDLSVGRFIELPAQARDVLPVVASTNPACAENLSPNAPCVPGPITRPYYSNFGASLGAIAAPGGSAPNVSETGVNGWVRGACSLTNCFDSGSSGYVQAMGTSASAPLVAGAAALVRAGHPAWTATQIMEALRKTATHTGAMAEGELNTAAALVAR